MTGEEEARAVLREVMSMIDEPSSAEQQDLYRAKLLDLYRIPPWVGGFVPRPPWWRRAIFYLRHPTWRA